jgi:hypothetical protein
MSLALRTERRLDRGRLAQLGSVISSAPSPTAAAGGRSRQSPTGPCRVCSLRLHRPIRYAFSVKAPKVVCTTCNTGWMSDLQNQVKPVIASMVDGRRVTLVPSHQRLPAAWTGPQALEPRDQGDPHIGPRKGRRDGADRVPGPKVPVFMDWRLRECDYGDMTGTAPELLERAEHVDLPYSSGESWRQAVDRSHGSCVISSPGGTVRVSSSSGTPRPGGAWIT